MTSRSAQARRAGAPCTRRRPPSPGRTRPAAPPRSGASFPISLYEDLNVGEIKARLADLTPAELRKVRDYERRNANRKGVLSAIESKLK